MQIPILVGKGSGFLNVSPGVLDFESVVLGESRELTVAIENLGTTVTALEMVEFGANIPADFTLVDTEIQETVEPGEIVTVTIKYTGVLNRNCDNLPGLNSFLDLCIYERKICGNVCAEFHHL